ncbi:UDP-N-acetylenolpyruvoylglucosamine reductase [bacterium (Candidatus Torokbacteria) CG_4_10_14_0_2_um_filter_35_8]|nr:MAG: UDP-N-acetylenolpyruvoylglucosamine reductase [bacterium (Candidatus Torokbacteria) CG_4_10_14_0_2_um_filter_35_8]
MISNTFTRKLEQSIRTKILYNEQLSTHTTFKIGGPAQYFAEIEDSRDLISVLELCKSFKIPFFILGGGSNLLVSDKGFQGVVVRLKAKDVKLIDDDTIKVDAGCVLSELVNFCAKKGLSGLENLAGIPGTVGGAVVGNAGALGDETGTKVKKVEVIDLLDLEVKTLQRKDLKFDYKESSLAGKFVVLKIWLELKKGNSEELLKIIEENIQKRIESQPYEFPSAGCIFKNISKDKKEELDIPTCSAGYLIDQCGLKGKKIGGAQISEKHANFIVNTGSAKAEDVLNLIDICKEKIKSKFNINLKEEIKFVGF